VTDPLLRLEPDRVTVEPGGQASVQVTVNNPGTIVESYRLDVVGEQPIDFAEVLPPTISVYPQQQETVTVVFSPPSGPGTPGGLVPFGIRATSEVDPTARSVAEGELTIGQVSGLQATLTPVTSSGRWRGRHTVQISNWGNAPARLKLVASDPDEALGFLLRPEVVDVPLGGKATARLKVRTRKPMLRGTPTRLPFQVVGEPETPAPVSGPVTPYADPGRPVADGALNQKPILSRLTVSVGVLSVLAVVAALVFALTRPEDPGAARGDGKTVPPKPQLAAKATGPASVMLSWEALRNVDSYTLQYFDSVAGVVFNTEQGISAQQNAKQVEKLNPATRYCFKLRGVNGDKVGPESDEACATTPKAAPTPSASGTPSNGDPTQDPGQGPQTPGQPTEQTPGQPTGQTPGQPTEQTPGQPTGQTPGSGPDSPIFTPDQWVAAVNQIPADSGIAETSARDLAQDLTQAGVPAGVLLANGQYPGLLNASGQPLTNSWVVYTNPGTDPQQIQNTCETKAKQVYNLAQCTPRQPARAP
jgi:Fibronectin type III domain